MPIYEFRCQKCNDQIEVFQKLSDKPPSRCRKCGGRMEKQFSRTSVQFKGEGWYVTDYAGKKSAGSDSAPAAKSDSSESKDSAAKEPSSKESKEKKPAKKKD